MVLIDSSVWIGLYRKKSTSLGEFIWSLVAKNEAAICGQVWVEFLGGFRKKTDFKYYESLLKGFPFIESSTGAYQLAASFIADYPVLGSGDAIIAATAIQSKIPLLTFDKDFKVLVKKGLELIPTGSMG
jgi:hypothetical protein